MAEASQAKAPALPRRRRALAASPSLWVLCLSGAVLAAISLLVLIGPWISPYEPNHMDASARLLPPSADHLFGTDQFGRDVFTRVIHGGRVTLEVAFTAVLTAVIAGALLGLVAGYYGGWIDAIATRVMDVMIAFPSLLLALFLVAVLGPDLTNLIIAISLTRVPYFARLTRAEVASLAQRPFISAGRTMGASDLRLLLRHILPNTVPLLIIFGTTDIATAVIAESSLSYLGLGAQPPATSWGRMLTEARGFLSQAVWLAVFPGLSIMITVICFNLFGDGLRDVLDPRLKGRR